MIQKIINFIVPVQNKSHSQVTLFPIFFKEMNSRFYRWSKLESEIELIEPCRDTMTLFQISFDFCV